MAPIGIRCRPASSVSPSSSDRLALRVVVGSVAVGFAYPWIAARSLWAPGIPHALGDFIADTILEL